MAADGGLSPAVLRELERLGATFDPNAGLSAVDWPRGNKSCDPSEDNPPSICFHAARTEMEAGSEYYGGIDVMTIGEDDRHYSYLVRADGGDTPGDPDVFCVDHAGPYELEDAEPLSKLLARLIPEPTPHTEEGVQIPDDALARAIFVARGGKRPDRAALTETTKLELSVHHVETLEGLEGFVNLRELSFDGHNIKGLATLAKLTRLQKLKMPNDAKDLRPLSGLAELQELTVGSNAKLAPLQRLPRLRRLTINGQVGDLAALAKLSNLTEVWMTWAAETPENARAVKRMQERGVTVRLQWRRA